MALSVRTQSRAWLLSAALLLVAADCASSSPGRPAPDRQAACAATEAPLLPPDAARPLRFGVTAAGQVLTQRAVPDDSSKTVAAIEELAGERPFLVRLNRVLYSKGKEAIKDATRRAELYTARGLYVSLQLRYGDIGFDQGTPEGYAAWLRRLVRRLGPNERVIGYEVTNEANLPSAPDNSDGSFAEAPRAVAEGIAAVDDEARKRGFDHVSVGFNWYYEVASPDEDAFWQGLAPYASELADALDWVGMTVYPGTFDQTPPGLEGRRIVEGLHVLRTCRLAQLGIAPDVPIRIMENGYPNAMGKPAEVQAKALERMVRAVADFGETYNVTDYNWFTLRDARTGSVTPSDVYGLIETDYDRKPAYGVYKELIAELGA